MFENIDQTIADLRRLLADQEQQVADTKKTINVLCLHSGRPIAFPDAERKSAGALEQLNGDEYYGKPLTTVVRLVLEARKAAARGPATINEIYESMIAGGYKFGTSNEVNSKTWLRASIRKGSQTFHRIEASGKIGLLEWYEGIKTPKSNGAAVNGHASNEDEAVVEEDDEAVAATAEVSKKPR